MTISYGHFGGIEIDHGDADFSAAPASNGGIEVMTGKDYQGAIGYTNSLMFTMTELEATEFYLWLGNALKIS